MIVFDHVPKCGGTTIINQLRKQVAGRHYILDGKDQSNGIGEFLAMSPAERATYSLVAGHNVHRLRRVMPRATWMIMFRDPIERVWSYYQYTQSQPWLREHFGITEDLFGFLDRSAEANCGWQYASGRDFYVANYVHSIRIGDEYSYAGTMEKPGQFVAEMKAIGLTIDMSEACNATRHKRPMTFDERIAIAAANRGDIEFYEGIKRGSVNDG